MNTFLKNKYLIGALCLAVGFIIGFKSKPVKVIESTELEKQQQLISQLQSRIETLKQTSTIEDLKTVIVEKPDGTKTTTVTKLTEKSSNITKLSTKEKKSELKQDLKLKQKKTTINSENNNAVGVSYQANVLDFSLSPTVYGQSGMKCFIFRCYVEGRYFLQTKDVTAAIGLELRF